MTVHEFCASVIADPAYRANLLERARKGTLSEEIELFILEMADGRVPPMPSAPQRAAAQGPTLALIRPSADLKVPHE
jgi:hypothetical protein